MVDTLTPTYRLRVAPQVVSAFTTTTPTYRLRVALPGFTTVSPTYRLKVAFAMKVGRIVDGLIKECSTPPGSPFVRPAKSFNTYPASRSFGLPGSYKPDAGKVGLPSLNDFTEVVEGNFTTSYDGQVIDRKRIKGQLIVLHKDVTAQRCLIEGPLSYAAQDVSGLTLPLVDATASGVRRFKMRDCEVRPQTASAWTVGFQGHDSTLERNWFHDLQDPVRVMNRSSAEASFFFAYSNLISDFTWFQIAAARAASEQTHNDAFQLQGAIGAVIVGNLVLAYFGSRGQRQPTLTTNTSTAWANDTPPVKSATTAPELACVMCNEESGTLRKISGLVLTDNWLLGGVTPINMGDNGLSGANIGDILRNRFSADSPANSANPAKYLRRRADQTVNFGQGTADCNTYYDGPLAGQELPVRTDA